MASVRSPESERLYTANAIIALSRSCAVPCVRTRALWAGPALFAVLGGAILFATLKRRRSRAERRELSAAERSRAEGLIDEGT